jgi:hypothetical protein
LAVVLTAMISSLWWSGSYADSLYVSDQILNTVTQFDAVTGAFQRVLITADQGGMVGPNGIVVNPVASPELVVANQNAGLPINGDIRVFDEGQGGAPIAVLVPDSDKKAPSAPFGILLYRNSLLIADEAGQVEVFDVTKTPARFAGNLDTTSYNKKPFHPFGMVVGPDGRLYVGTRSGQPGVPGDVIRFDLAKSKFIDVFVSGESCLCSLDRPSGVVFGPDLRLYVTSSRPPANQNPPMGDTDKILVFNGTTGVLVDRIDLDMAGANDRSGAPGLLFGPDGLYLTIAQTDASGIATGVGSIRKYNVTNKQFQVIVQPNTTLKLPTLFTFGSTNPTTLAYGK